MSEPWPTVLTFIAAVLGLYLLQRWITQHVQGIGMLVFGGKGAGLALLWVILLPGIIVHELSHWLMARLLGLKTGHFRIWPQLKGREIVLGSVEVQRSNPLLDSLVGLAPFLGGTTLLLLIGYQAFDAAALGRAWEQGTLSDLVAVLLATLQVPDSWVWLYMLVAISNAMMPSPTDRESWKSVVIYIALINALLLVLGWWPDLAAPWVSQMAASLTALIYALALTLAIDLVFALGIGLAEFLIGVLRGTRVVYK